MDARLQTHYLSTSYRVDCANGPIVLRIGHRNGMLDSLVASSGATEWAFVTAWNPESRPLAQDENAARHLEMCEDLRHLGFVLIPGEGVPAQGDWKPEESVLVVGIDREAARRVGERFGQNAIVVGRIGERAELLICGEGGEIRSDVKRPY